MRPLALEEVVPLAPYTAIRDVYRRAVIGHKRSRRLGVGPSVTLIFEDRETLRFQVQEMLFVERISSPTAVQHELDVYNELMPGPGELSATLMVEITEPGRIRAELDRLVGIDEHVALVLGDGDDARRIPALFDPKQLEEERISAVQYIRFRLDPDGVRAFRDPMHPVAIEIDHPAYRHRTALPGEMRASLAAGLETEPPSLLPALPPADASKGPLYENSVAQVREGQTEGALQVIGRAPLAALDERGWEQLLEALRRATQLGLERGERVRVEAELGREERPRWRIEPLVRP